MRDVVVVGGGIVGASVAYHLACAGEQDVIVLERASVAAGTSWHAAGLVSRGRATHFLTKLASYGVDFYRELGDRSGIEVGLRQPGSLLLARTGERLRELRYADGVARHHGIPSEIVSPERVAELHGLASPTGLVGALHQPDDGHVNPGYAALAIAALAHKRGVSIHEGVRVTRVRTDAGRVAATETTTGVVECERVVLATGLWTRDLAAASGCSVPVWPATHVHVRTAPIDGAVDSLPSLRDLDGFLYVRQANGALLVGAFEPEGKPIDPQTLPADFAFGELDPDWEHFAPVRRLAEERVPALRDSVNGRSNSTRSCVTFGVIRPRSPRSRRTRP